MSMITLSPAGTAKCAVSGCDSPHGKANGPNFARNTHTEVSVNQLILMGQGGWLCSAWISRHVAAAL